MKLRDGGLLILLGVLMLCASVGIISSKYMGDDNPVEEVSEVIIESQTGLDIDLTPDSPEKPYYTNEELNVKSIKNLMKRFDEKNK